MKIPDTQKLLNPKRLPEETYEEYKSRRKMVNLSLKNYLKGSIFYDSNNTSIPYKKYK